ncbi:hypothetical protein BU24DRAFT_480117 [Aaosphaeria arxii CBS 175.79]|uniref:Uncharacterized protein n=1 Tax=Aaosphaeria arxii CBS 175.79 TaxID=1450172 RepID=A0A6A5XRE2_9PLEO|nr:uncharacterized protein BU24DRAFT_480117 [Aaosphaeria arxii CBS 175.79]KAF2015321.1 hypothetical protein BU24DRAFT_480117 [Aaosphaeria arxii CBS 175.79]
MSAASGSQRSGSGGSIDSQAGQADAALEAHYESTQTAADVAAMKNVDVSWYCTISINGQAMHCLCPYHCTLIQRVIDKQDQGNNALPPNERFHEVEGHTWIPLSPAQEAERFPTAMKVNTVVGSQGYQPLQWTDCDHHFPVSINLLRATRRGSARLQINAFMGDTNTNNTEATANLWRNNPTLEYGSQFNPNL